MNTMPLPLRFDWTLMRSFLAVLERGSLLGAARHLGGSQPTLGRHVAELERQLGVALFERTGRGLVPTTVAWSIADQARAMADSAEAIGRTLTGQSRQIAGVVRITASQIVATHLLPALLATLRAAEPGIAIEIVSSNTISNLLRREADIAIRMVKPEQKSLIARRIGNVGIGVYAQQDYLRRRGIPRTAADLPQHDLIGFDHDDVIIRSFRALGLSIERDAFGIRSDDHLVLWESLRAGLGIGFCATWLADREPGIRRILPELAIPSLPVWLTVHREIRSSARIRVVYDFLAKAIPVVLT
ncbi:MAG: LysR family transcriptional regulator [Proteobacteria bacterium]|nr:LysR family transcriptional regulator [Pseudomonadota bacterium]